MEKNIFGEISLEELKEMSQEDDVTGGVGEDKAISVISTLVSAASIALCPTTKCTSKC